MLWSVVCEASAEGWAGLACGKAGIHQRRQHCERMRMHVSMWACGVLTMSETYLVTRPTIRRRARRVAGVIYDAFGIRRKKRHQMNKPPARAVALVSAAPTGVDTVSIKRRTAQGNARIGASLSSVCAVMRSLFSIGAWTRKGSPLPLAATTRSQSSPMLSRSFSICCLYESTEWDDVLVGDARVFFLRASLVPLLTACDDDDVVMRRTCGERRASIDELARRGCVAMRRASNPETRRRSKKLHGMSSRQMSLCSSAKV